MNRPEKLRISVIGPSTRFLSGISYYTIRLCNALSEKNLIQAVLFRNMLPKRLFPGWKRVGETVVTGGINSSVNVYEILDWYNPFTWAYAARIIRKSDFIILEWWTSSIVHMYIAILFLCTKKCRYIIEFHEVVDPLESGILPLRLYAKIGGRIIRRSASRFVVHSEYDRELISQQYRIQPSRIAVIPHGLYDQYEVLDMEQSKKKLGLSGKYVILFFGLLRPYKGVIHLIRAFENLQKDILDNSVLVIAGETWEDQDSVTAAEKSPYSDKIKIYNRYIADDEIPDFFSAADLLVLPYTRASQSGVAHIGIVYGLPIIASKVGGLTEGLGSYQGTRFIPPSDMSELKSAIKSSYLNTTAVRYEPPDELRWNVISRRFLEEMEICINNKDIYLKKSN